MRVQPGIRWLGLQVDPEGQPGSLLGGGYSLPRCQLWSGSVEQRAQDQVPGKLKGRPERQGAN